jgi:hypothetical protein
VLFLGRLPESCWSVSGWLPCVGQRVCTGMKCLTRGGETAEVSQVNGSRVEWNPSAARLRELTGKMANASMAEFGNVNVKARVDSRSTRSTYLVEDATNSRGQTFTRAEYERVAALQDAHIAASRMVAVDGFTGSDPKFRTRGRLTSAGGKDEGGKFLACPVLLRDRRGHRQIAGVAEVRIGGARAEGNFVY